MVVTLCSPVIDIADESAALILSSASRSSRETVSSDSSSSSSSSTMGGVQDVSVRHRGSIGMTTSKVVRRRGEAVSEGGVMEDILKKGGTKRLKWKGKKSVTAPEKRARIAGFLPGFGFRKKILTPTSEARYTAAGR
jgi:hypothetical protein